MAATKNDVGKPDSNSTSYCVTNRANQPREFKIRGKWYRWEPAGRAGDSVTLSADEQASADFAYVSKYFHVAEVSNATA